MIEMYSTRCTHNNDVDGANVTDQRLYDDTADTSVRELMSQEYLVTSWPTVAFQCLLCTVGLLGNTIVFLAFVQRPQKNSANYYMICLAMIDLFCCAVVIPLKIMHTAIYFRFYSATGCKLLEWLKNASLAASSIILQATALDRYQAVCKPFAWRKSKLLKSPLVPIFCVALGFITMFPFLIMAGIEEYQINREVLWEYGFRTIDSNLPGNASFCFSLCELLNEYEGTWENQVFFFLSLLIFVTLMSVTILSYGAVYLTMRRHMKKFGNKPTNVVGNKVSPMPTVSRSIVSGMSDSETAKVTKPALPEVQENSSLVDRNLHLTRTSAGNIRENQFKVAKTLMMVTIVFVLSWVPFWVMTFISIFDPSFVYYQSMGEHTLKVFFSDLYFMNNALNPVVYFIYSRPFRLYCQQLYMNCTCSKTRRHQGQ